MLYLILFGGQVLSILRNTTESLFFLLFVWHFSKLSSPKNSSRTTLWLVRAQSWVAMLWLCSGPGHTLVLRHRDHWDPFAAICGHSLVVAFSGSAFLSSIETGGIVGSIIAAGYKSGGPDGCERESHNSSQMVVVIPFSCCLLHLFWADIKSIQEPKPLLHLIAFKSGQQCSQTFSTLNTLSVCDHSSVGEAVMVNTLV